MKKYYRGPIKRLDATDIKKDNNRLKYKKEIKTVKENVLFYRNFLNKLIRYKDSYPIFSEDEIHDIINLIYEESNSSSCSLEYVDTNELILQKETPEEVKKSKRLFRKK